MNPSRFEQLVSKDEWGTITAPEIHELKRLKAERGPAEPASIHLEAAAEKLWLSPLIALGSCAFLGAADGAPKSPADAFAEAIIFPFTCLIVIWLPFWAIARIARSVKQPARAAWRFCAIWAATLAFLRLVFLLLK